MAETIEIGLAPEGVQGLALKRANRHGLIAGATGTGKTVTLQVLAEAFAREGVNVFAADIKGDLSGCAAVSDPPPGLGERARNRNQHATDARSTAGCVLGCLWRTRPPSSHDRH
jgi:AAA+ superfamily predicted ATPase